MALVAIMVDLFLRASPNGRRVAADDHGRGRRRVRPAPNLRVAAGLSVQDGMLRT
jgi:hypothetical protein